MKRFTQIALVGVLVLIVASIAAAQQAPQPVVRLGDYIEVGNDVFMHFIATTEFKYHTTSNYDFESQVRDRVGNREITSTQVINQTCDCLHYQTQLGVDVRYQKDLTVQILGRWEALVDGPTSDTRSGSNSAAGGGTGLNPGGTDTFGRPAVGEADVFNMERAWIDYHFPGTPINIRIGTDLWYTDQFGMISDDDPRFVVFYKSDPFDAYAQAVVEVESARIGLTNDNDLTYYTFGAGYNLKPHRFQVDVTYVRDRNQGADVTPTPTTVIGMKHDSFVIMPSWSGLIGPVFGMVQINGLLGHGNTTTEPGKAGANRDMDILAWGAMVYFEARLPVFQPFIGMVYGSGDGDPTDRKLHGFMTLPIRQTTTYAGRNLDFLDKTASFGSRDVVSPAGNLTANVLGGQEFSHNVSNPYNDRLGNFSHPGITSTYSNPGTVLAYLGTKITPLQGHQIALAGIYRGTEKTALLSAPVAQGGLGRKVRNALYEELWGQYQWTINPHFDIRLAGSLIFPDVGSRDAAKTVDCDPGPAFRQCEGQAVAMSAEARFRARF